MAVVSSQLRELASLLSDAASKEIINSVKSKLISIAEDLEQKHTASLLKSQDFDDILNEIEAQENTLSNMEYKTLQQAIVDTFETFEVFPIMRDEKIFKYHYKLNRTTWMLLFHHPDKTLLQKWQKQSKDIYIEPALGKVCQDISDQDLLKIFDAIPKALKDEKENDFIHEDNFEDLAKWMIAYKTDNSNVNINRHAYNKIYTEIIRYGYWHKLRFLVQCKSVDVALTCYNKYQKYIDINRRSIDLGKTLLHYGAENLNKKSGNMSEWLLSIKGIDYDIKDFSNKTAMDLGKEAGNWIAVNKLIFASMGNKMRQKADEEIAKLNRNKGIVAQWFRFYPIDNIDSDEYKSMTKMVESLKTLIRNKLPISDDLLLICFSFEMKQNQNDPLKCSLWKCLYDTLNNCLRIPLNRRNWLWFKQYIFGCS
eukprot:269785_1